MSITEEQKEDAVMRVTEACEWKRRERDEHRRYLTDVLASTEATLLAVFRQRPLSLRAVIEL